MAALKSSPLLSGNEPVRKRRYGSIDTARRPGGADMAAELAALSQLWRSFELKKFLEELDHAANELLLMQSESDCSRKKLVEQSREFKKSTNEETWSVVAPLLKSFQAEIDSLSRRSRAAETEFLKVYKKMIDLPDPTMALERAVLALQQERRTPSFGGLSASSRQQQPDTSTAARILSREDASSRACRGATTNGHSEQILSQFAGCLDPKNVASGGARTNHSCSTLVHSARSESAPEKVRRLPATQSADEIELWQSPQPPPHQQEESWRSKDLSRLSVAERTLAVMKSALEKAQVELLEMKRRYGGAASPSPSSSPRRDESERSCNRIRQGSCEGCQCRLPGLVDRGAGGSSNGDCCCNKAADRSGDPCCEMLPPPRCDERGQPAPQSSSASFAFDKMGLPERLPPEDTGSLLQEQANCCEPRRLSGRHSGSAAASDRGALLSIRPQWAARFLDPSGLSANLHDENSCDSSCNGAAIADGCTTNRRHAGRSTDRTGRATPTPSRELSMARGYESPTGSAGSYGVSVGADLLSRSGYPRELDFPTDTLGDHSKEVLDTADVSSRVKEILSNNSIGQRLFAKQVLGLSQGTVSELLSKPKHWDKLTEKGRESYRKMNQWLSDQHNVDALKSQSPRRSGPVSSAKSDAASTEERISQILREAQAAMQLRQLEEQSMRQPQQMLTTAASGVTASMAIQPSSELLAAESIGRQLAKHRGLAPPALPPPPTPPGSAAGTTDTQRLRDAALSEAMVSRIYEEELLKLALQASLAGNSTDYALYQAELRRLSEKRWWTGDRERPIVPASVSPATSAAETCTAATAGHGDSNAGEQRPAAYSDDEDCNTAPAATAASWVSAGVGGSGCSAPIGSDLPPPAHGRGSVGSREGAGSRDRLELQQQPPPFPTWPPLQTVKHEPPDEADNGSRHESPTPPTSNQCRDAGSDLSAPQDEPVDFTMDRRRTEQQQHQHEHSPAVDQPQHRPLAPPCHWPLLAPSDLSSSTPGVSSPVGTSPSISQPQLQQQQKDGRLGEGDDQRFAELGSTAGAAAAAASPLLKMQTVAHAFLSSSQAHLLTAPQKPLRVVLPPIAPEQFERYASICTEELVGRVKKVLSDYSISQRLFGESVLGLSQGSVSDLLARPKPWSMLTQKGREPFIRMHIFIDDPLAVKRLMTNQYHHHHHAAGQPSSSSLSPMSSAHSMLLQQQHHLQLQQLPLPPDVHMTPQLLALPTQPPSNARGCLASSPVEAASMATLSGTEVLPSVAGPSTGTAAAEPAGRVLQQSRMTVASAMSASGLTGHVQPHEDFSSAAGVLAGVGWHRATALSSGCRIDYSPSSAMPTLDTLAITSRVKDVLCYHGIGQKLFGEAVLGLSQGSVSDMLSKPKPWELLSVKGREPFVKMQYWLSDPNNVERLQALQAEVKASRKTASAADDASSDRSSPCIKKARYSFTDEQKRVLRTAFAQDPYPTSASIDALAQRMSLSTKTVINWFHNHRMRSKQQLREGDDHSQQHCQTNAVDSVAATAPRAPSIHGSGNAANTATAANSDATAAATQHRRMAERRQASRCDESAAASAAAAAACGEQPDVDSSCGGGASSHGRLDLGGFRCSSDDHDHADRSEGDYYEDDDEDDDRVDYGDDDMFEADGRWAIDEGSPAAQQQRSAATGASPDSERGSSSQASGPNTAAAAVDGPAGTNAGFGGQVTAAAATACPTPCAGNGSAGSSSRKRKSSHPQYVHQGRDLDHRDDDAGDSSAIAAAAAQQRRLLAPAATAARASEPSSPTAADDVPSTASAAGPSVLHGEMEAAMRSALATADRVEYGVETAAAAQAVRAAAAAARQEKLDFVARMERLISGSGDGSGGDTDWDERPDRKGNVELLELNLARTQASAAGDDWCV